MAGLLDIAPLSETVTVRGQAVEVTGISAAGVAMLLRRFPALRKLLAQRPDAIGEIRRWRILRQGENCLSFYQNK